MVRVHNLIKHEKKLTKKNKILVPFHQFCTSPSSSTCLWFIFQLWCIESRLMSMTNRELLKIFLQHTFHKVSGLLFFYIIDHQVFAPICGVHVSSSAAAIIRQFSMSIKTCLTSIRKGLQKESQSIFTHAWSHRNICKSSLF